jgi:hypothetical protein
MSVNLDRLRKARDDWGDGYVRNHSVEAVLKSVDLLLDAPRRWVCRLGQDRAFGDPERRCVFDSYGVHDGCGWVVLVPVEGEGKL